MPLVSLSTGQVDKGVFSLDSNNSSTNQEHSLLADVTGVELLNSVKLQLAQQYAPRLWRAWIESLILSLERGASLDEAVDKLRSSAPRELGVMVDSAMRVGAPTQLILDALRARESLRRSWRELWFLLLYPTVTLVFATSIGVMFSSAMDFNFLSEFGLSGADQILAMVHDQQQSMYGLAFVIGWTILLLGTIAVIGPAWALTSIIGGVRVFGRPLRWINLSEILHRYQLFIVQGLPTVDAAAAVSRSFSSSAQRYAAEGIERRIRQGTPLGAAFASTSLSDGLCRPALRMLDYRGEDLTTALGETSELLRNMVEQRCRSLAGVVPLLVLLIVGSVVWSIFSCYFLAFMPLVSMITSLA
jgi:type II secretory pathway component PulF